MKNDKPVTFAFLGDLMLGGEFVPYAEQQEKDFLSPFYSLESVFSDVDILFINLEGPICDGPVKRPGVSAVISNHPAVLKLFTKAGMRVLNISNNHIMDCGVEGLNKTIEVLEREHIYHVGAGENLDEASSPLVIECRGRRIAFLSYTSDELFIGSVIATEKTAGCASYKDIECVKEKIERLKKEADIICVSLHWGYEYFSYPSEEQVAMAHCLVDAGVDYVIGHHPHVLQGIELYKGSLIMYSLGNFFFPPIKAISGRPQYKKEMTKEFMMIKSRIDAAKELKWEICGGRQNSQLTLDLRRDEEQTRFLNKISELSAPIKRNDYRQYWENYKAKRVKQLGRESITDALRKMRMMSLKELIGTITVEDIKRNLVRLLSLLLPESKYKSNKK